MESILGVSVDDIVNYFERLLRIFKDFLAWLGIFILPEDNDDATEGE